MRSAPAATNPARMGNNLDWLGRIPMVDFLRDTGKHFRVNDMLRKESVRMRLEKEETGISFTEFSYLLLQAYDYLELHRRFGCTLQMGGSDQWGNITAGIDLIRRVEGAHVHGVVFPLLYSTICHLRARPGTSPTCPCFRDAFALSRMS